MSSLIYSVNLKFYPFLFIQWASGFQETVDKSNFYNTEISTYGIIFGGFINGKLKDGFIQIFILFFKVIYKFGKYWHNLPWDWNT